VCEQVEEESDESRAAPVRMKNAVPERTCESFHSREEVAQPYSLGLFLLTYAFIVISCAIIIGIIFMVSYLVRIMNNC
jgi:hypothetical protein